VATAANVIIKMRDTLGDPDGDRWDDDRLIRAINEAQETICEKANILRTKATIQVSGGVSIYELPTDSLLLTRVDLEGVNIPLKSMEEMDEVDPDWMATEAETPTIIVYDRLNRGSFRLYPSPTLDLPDEPSSVPDYGFTTEMTGIDIEDDFGVLATITDIKDSLTVYYTKKPIEVTVVGDTLELNDVWHRAIKYFGCGMLLRDDKDTQNRAMGNEELQLYVGELEEIKDNSSKDFTKATQYESDYRSL